MTVSAAWSDAIAAAQLFAVDPPGVGGIWLRARAGPVRERWLAMLRTALPPTQPIRQVPLHIPDGRLLGGLDLNATLIAGKPIAERGLLAEADGGVVILAMAERLPSSTVAHITSAMDAREAIVERDGLSLRMPSRFGVIALDEGLDDEAASAALCDRLGLHLDLDEVAIADALEVVLDGEKIQAARERLVTPKPTAAQVEAICTAAAALGIVSLRASLLTVRVACSAAALEGRVALEQDDIALAARLVLAPRALVFPQSAQPDEQQPAPPESPADSTSDQPDGETQTPDIDRAMEEVILAAVAAALPADVLAALRISSHRSRARSMGKAGALQNSSKRGRPAGVRRGDVRAGARLNVIETLRAAAPWQPLRRREANATGDDATRPRIVVRKDDFRIARFKQRTESTMVFVVDASGSAALHRLAETKGAVELLLADCYIRRDQVALIAFRGSAAELLLPPTRSLARAKRSLAGLPGGGGTPLAAGLDAAFVLSDSIRRKGQTPTVIVLTDGRANIARDGGQGRPRAEEDALGAARQLRGAGFTSVLIDTSPRPGAAGENLASEMGARYLPLPHADSMTLSQAVLATTRSL